jgi:hypothetical protein
MSEFTGMSWEVFNENYPTIAWEARTIKAAGKSAADLRERRRLTLYEDPSGHWILDVIDTTYGPVVWRRKPSHRYIRQSKEPEPEPLTGDPNQVFEIVTPTRGYPLEAWRILDTINAGKREGTIMRPSGLDR